MNILIYGSGAIGSHLTYVLNNNENKIQNLSLNIDSYLTKNLSSMYLKIKEIVINSQSRVLTIKTSYLSVLKELEDDSKFLENLIENAELELQ